MKNTSKTLIFFGNERLVSGLEQTDAPTLRALIAAGYHIAAVISHHSDGRSRSNRKLEVAEIAAAHNIPVLLPNRPSEIIETLRGFNAEAAVLAAYGRIIPQSIIDLFPRGIINIHPSLLPKYRGPTPIESAILNGDSETGVSIMQLTAGMDEGPVFVQVKTPLTGNETKFELYKNLAPLGAETLIRILPSILDGSLKPAPQDNKAATYCSLLSKEDGILNPEARTAQEIERMIRAYLGFPKTKLTIHGHPIVITKAHSSTAHHGVLDIVCKNSTILTIDELTAPSGRRMNAEAFLNGYK